jgi:hypothetical protein
MTFSLISCHLWDNLGKCNRARKGTDDITIRRMRIAFWMNKATNTQSEYVILTAFPRKRRLLEGVLMLLLYVHCFLVGARLMSTYFFWGGDNSPQWARVSFTRFRDHTQRRTTIRRTSLDEWSARRRDLYLRVHNTHQRQTSKSPVGFELTISAGERPQTHTLQVNRAVTGTGYVYLYQSIFIKNRVLP